MKTCAYLLKNIIIASHITLSNATTFGIWRLYSRICCRAREPTHEWSNVIVQSPIFKCSLSCNQSEVVTWYNTTVVNIIKSNKWISPISSMFHNIASNDESCSQPMSRFKNKDSRCQNPSALLDWIWDHDFWTHRKGSRTVSHKGEGEYIRHYAKCVPIKGGIWSTKACSPVEAF